MIFTITMNPAVDKTARSASIVPGGLNRLGEITLDAGGKGINVSKMINALGGTSVATGFLGGSSGSDILGVLNKLGIKTDFVNIESPTRINLKVLSDDFGITEFNEPGPAVTSCEMDLLFEKLLGFAKPGSIFAFSGSLPQGVSPGIYQQLIETVKNKGASVFLDADGEAFRSALLSKPDYIKPNKYELTQYFNVDGDCSLGEAAYFCKRLIEQGVKMVTLSMGSEGAMFVTESECLYAPAVKVKALSTVGAGDSMVGAILYALTMGLDLKETAALAMAASAGAVTTQGTNPPSRKIVDDLLKQVEFQNIP